MVESPLLPITQGGERVYYNCGVDEPAKLKI